MRGHVPTLIVMLYNWFRTIPFGNILVLYNFRLTPKDLNILQIEEVVVYISMVYTIIPNVCNLYQKNDPAFLLKCALMNVDLFANTHYLDWDQKPLHCCMLKFWCVGKYSGGFFGAPENLFQTKAEHRWFESCLVQQGLTEIWTILWAGWLYPSWSTDYLGYNQRAAFLHAPLTITTVFSWHGQLPAPSDRENLIAPLEGFFHQCRLWLQKRKLHYLWSALDWLLQYIALSQSLTFKTRVFVYFVQSLCSLQGLY